MSCGELGVTTEVRSGFPIITVIMLTRIHTAAWKASQYLTALISTSQISLKPSAVLDQIYAKAHPSLLTKPSDLLLTLDEVPGIAEAFKFNDEDAGALRRSVVQAEARLLKATSASAATEKVQAEEGSKDKRV